MESLPNTLTTTRVLIVPLLIATFFLPDRALGNKLALILFVIGGLTDFFDGMIARALRAESKFGTMLDPIADKLLVVSILVLLVFDRQENMLPRADVLPALVIILREIFVSGMREFLAAENVKMPVTHMAKWKTTIQFVAITCILAAPFMGADKVIVLQLGNIMLWVAAVITLVTGVIYYRHTMGYISLSDRDRDEY